MGAGEDKVQNEVAGQTAWKAALVEGLAALGLTLRSDQEERLARYLARLRAENERLNLTAVVEPVEVALKHFVDSATVLRAVELPPGESLADVGSGGGFPGVPLAILRPDLRVTLIEANRKKAAFLGRLQVELGLEQVTVVNARAEEVGRQAAHRERYGLAVARAVAPLAVVWEYLLPLVRVGGTAVALKGPGVAEELPPGGRAAKVLGGGGQIIHRFLLPRGAGERQVVAVQKVAASPAQYPRRPGVPAKKPL
ncbi:MAG: 16S rRNA (guanine(527)-N(7))-methyltransferase RsmG [Bacillota bacterium]|nr:16S rRNA (guanine(527)-N(7))-methyltransferase RsmG [Bacillota bacterium]